jgi:hypothetical protein
MIDMLTFAVVIVALGVPFLVPWLWVSLLKTPKAKKSSSFSSI